MDNMFSYEPSMLDDVENIENYRQGGFHPVHLGDRLNNGQYKVMHKLGFGGSATVWFAKDTEKGGYVALKIILADISKHHPELMALDRLKNTTSVHPGRKYIMMLLDSFCIDGPNGMHLCLVLDVGGPSIPVLSREQVSQKLPPRIAQRVAFQVAQGLSYMHYCGLAHGDLTTSNLLTRIDSLNELTEDQALQLLGPPVEEEVVLASGQSPSPSAPEYVVEATNTAKLMGTQTIGDVLIIDLGQSFDLTTPPAMSVGTPLAFCAPELLFENKASVASDIWALACGIFEIRAGYPLFESFVNSKDEIITDIVQALGKLPEPWWTAWEKRSVYFDDNGLPHEVWTTQFPLAEIRPLRTHVTEILCGNDSDSEDEQLKCESKDLIFTEELEMLYHLLSAMLKYIPEERPSAERVCTFSWMTSRLEG